MNIRGYQKEDWPEVWSIIKQECENGETLALSPEISEQEAHQFWIVKPQQVFVTVDTAGQVLGTYFIKPNQATLGAHVCNCGYLVSNLERGKGIGTLMCQHSLDLAKQLGFKSMQFNFVIATNEGAVRLWKKFGFDIVGVLPNAFHRNRKEYVDALIMFRNLVDY